MARKTIWDAIGEIINAKNKKDAYKKIKELGKSATKEEKDYLKKQIDKIFEAKSKRKVKKVV